MRIAGKIALAGVSLLTLARPAHAQDASADDGYNDDAIVVQARRKEESIQDVPVTVQAVTAQEIQKLEIRRFEDVVAVVPAPGCDTGQCAAP